MHTFGKVLLIATLVSFGATNGLQITLGNIAKSAKDITSGVAQSAVNAFPTPQGIFEASKNAIAGYPFEVVFSAINQICSAALSSQTITPEITPDIDKVQFQLRTACNRSSVPLKQARDLWHVPQFDPSKKVVILVTGWETMVNDSSTIDEYAKAFACRGNVNFVALDVGHFIDTLYTWSAFNTEILGIHLAEGLQELITIAPLENIHLIGHSLGAHIVGAAGRYFQELTNFTLPRITGLDPAKPCFNEGESLTGLMRGDADLVDIVHSNPGVLGKRDPLGDIDFYPGGLDPLPIGCLTITCAHQRAWQYFVETIYPGNEENFIGYRCRSLKRLREGRCVNMNAIMGYAVSKDKKGNYFMEVRAEAPFGMGGTKQRFEALSSCGVCPNNNDQRN